jgi:hypothetical protein
MRGRRASLASTVVTWQASRSRSPSRPHQHPNQQRPGPADARNVWPTHCMPGESIGALASDLGDERRCQTIDRGRRPPSWSTSSACAPPRGWINSSPNIGEAQGSRKCDRDVALEVAQTAVVSIALQVGTVNESTAVRAHPVLLETRKTQACRRSSMTSALWDSRSTAATSFSWSLCRPV